MAEKINLAEFNIDIESLTQAAAETAKAIQMIKDEQKDLVKEGKTTDQAFIRNSVNLRGLQKDYNAQLKVLDQYMNASGKQVSIQQRVDIAMRREINSINDVRAQTSELTKIRNEANLNSEEGRKIIEQLNAAIDKNNDVVKGNVSFLEQQKISIGSYADGIRDALGETDLFSGALGKFQSILNSVTPMLGRVQEEAAEVFTEFKNVTAGTEGMTIAQKASAVATNLTSASLKLLKVALISTGIGAIVVLLGSLVAYLTSSEQASSRFSKTLKVVGGMIREVIRYLEPLGELLMDGIEAGFQAVGKAAQTVLGLLAKGLKAVGFDEAAQGIENFTNNMEQAAKRSAQMAEAELKMADAQRKAEMVMLDYQKQAERLRQVRDDENRSIGERIKANEQLSAVLRKQIQEEQRLASMALYHANLRIAAEGRTKEALDAQAEAMAKMVDIQERVEGQMSEQMTNRVSLQKEAASQAKSAADAAKEQAQKRIDAMKEELELYSQQQGIRARTIEQEIKLEQDLSDRRKAILDQELKSKLISQTNYNRQVLEMEQNIAKLRSEAAVQEVQRALDLTEDRIAAESRISNAIGEAKLDLELANEEKLREARSRAEMVKFEQGLINEEEYQDAISQIRLDYAATEAEIERERQNLLREQKMEQMELDMEASLLAFEELGANVYELQSMQVEQQRLRDLEAARQKYTDEAMLQQAIMNINSQASLEQEKIAKERDSVILQSKIDLLGAIAQIFGEETLIGKAAAIAQATMNTYLGATKALASLPPPASFIAAGTTIATGLASVAKIVGIGGKSKAPKIPAAKDTATEQQAIATINAIPPFASGGKVTGGPRIRRSNGDNVLATLKTGEVVLNERQQRALGGDHVFRSIGVPGFATGGLVNGNNVNLQSSITRGLNDASVEAISTAVREGAMVGTEIGSRQGIVDLSTERYLQNLSSF